MTTKNTAKTAKPVATVKAVKPTDNGNVATVDKTKVKRQRATKDKTTVETIKAAPTFLPVGAISVAKGVNLEIVARADYMDRLTNGFTLDGVSITGEQAREQALRDHVCEGMIPKGDEKNYMDTVFRFVDTPEYRAWTYANHGTDADVVHKSRITQWSRMRQAIVAAIRTAKVTADKAATTK